MNTKGLCRELGSRKDARDQMSIQKAGLREVR